MGEKLEDELAAMGSLGGVLQIENLAKSMRRALLLGASGLAFLGTLAADAAEDL